MYLFALIIDLVLGSLFLCLFEFGIATQQCRKSVEDMPSSSTVSLLRPSLRVPPQLPQPTCSPLMPSHRICLRLDCLAEETASAEKFRRCADCKISHYCVSLFFFNSYICVCSYESLDSTKSRTCQRADWKLHKPICRITTLFQQVPPIDRMSFQGVSEKKVVRSIYNWYNVSSSLSRR